MTFLTPTVELKTVRPPHSVSDKKGVHMTESREPAVLANRSSEPTKFLPFES